MRKKKILLVIEGIGSGGAENQICRLTSLLTNAGYECRLISYVENQFYEPFLESNHVDYAFLPELRPKVTRVFRMIKYIKKYAPECVISYLPSVNKLLCLCRLFCDFNLIVSERNNEMWAKTYYLIAFNLYRLANHIVTNTYTQYDYIREHYSFLSKKLSVIVNFVDTDVFIPSSEKEDNQKFTILLVGRYAIQKNVARFLDSVSEIKKQNLPIKFEWIGSVSVDSSYYSMCCEKVKTLGIEDYVVLSPETDNLLEKYQKADAFCLPSIYEGYPNVILEAMSCQLPILCSNICDNATIVKENVNGFLFDPYDIQQMVDSIKKLYNLPSKEKILMGQNNRKLCLLRNSKENFLQQYIDLL